MHARILSDLHLELGDRVRIPANLGRKTVDLVVLAGDIDVGIHGIRWAQAAFPNQKVIYVLGSYEYFGQDFDRLIEEARAFAHGSNVMVLENEAIEVGGLRILGCTLWTDFQAMGAELEAVAKAEAQRYGSIYSHIRSSGSVLTLTQVSDRCRASYAWLSRQIAEATRPLLVVTHYAPTQVVADPARRGELLAAPANAFEDLLHSPVRAWVYGQTHQNCDLIRKGVRVISNQKGYPWERTKGFDWDRVFDLGFKP